MPRLEEWFRKWARGRGVLMADKLAAKMRQLCSVRAPVRRTRTGRIVAATPAIPGAPPRYVTGNLWEKIRTVRTAHGGRVVVWAPYGYWLEKSIKHPHQFLRPALVELGLKGRNSQ